MEAFSLLKYWRGGGGVGAMAGGGDSEVNTRATTIVKDVTHTAVETDDDDDDDGPFFDLEFAAPDEEDEEEKEEKKERNVMDSEDQNDDVVTSDDDDDEDDDGTDGEREFDFTLSSGSSNDRTDHNLALSPSDDLFFKGRLVPIESSSLVFNGAEPNSKPPQFPVSLLKSATKFRVFMLGFKKSKMNKNNTAEKTNEEAEAGNGSASASATPKLQDESKQSKFFTVKFKVEEVPIVSLFTRENSKSVKSQKQNNNNNNNNNSNSEESAASSDEKQRFSKDVMQKYLKKVKPLYIRVSKRYGEKLRFSGQLSLGTGLKTSAAPSPSTATASGAPKSPPVKSISAEKDQPETDIVEVPTVGNIKSVKQGNLPAGLRVVCKHLGKSRSASSAAVAAAPPGPVLSRRRDDSLLQQQDGIQSAILHCKRSFNASRGNALTN